MIRFVAVVACAWFCAVLLPAQGGARLAPYRALRYQGDKVEVQHDGKWCELTAIDDVATVDILAHCRQRHGDRWQKRFAEDLVQVLTEMGHAPKDKVKLGLIDLTSGAPFVAKDVAMTVANNQSVLQTRMAGGVAPAAAPKMAIDVRGPDLSPFRAIRDAGDHLEVQVDGDAWFEWVALDKVPAAEIVRWAKANLGKDWWKRINEDLPALLAAMEQTVGTDVELQLRSVTTGERERRKVAMTRENRRRLMSNDHEPDGAPMSDHLGAASVGADLLQLRSLLDQRFAYRHRPEVDIDALFAAARQQLGSGDVKPAQFAGEVQRLLAAFADGDAGVADSAGFAAPGFLPCLIEETAGGCVAFAADRTAFVDPNHPFVLAIDGEPIAKWLDAAGVLVAPGSAEYRRYHAVRLLRWLQQLRVLHGVATRPVVEVTFGDAAGNPAPRTLELHPRPPAYGTWPRRDSRILDGNLGYLRLADTSDDDAELDAIDARMADFKATRGLIVDVRGSGGGSRQALRRLFPYLLAAQDPPRVAGIAAFRLTKGTDDPNDAQGYLADQGLYPANWSGWSDAARTAIIAASRRFKPEWTPPAGQFSALHYFVLQRSDNGKAYHYERPVVVLLDGGSCGAADTLLGACKGWHDVTLIGSSSSGSGARPQFYRLQASGLALRLASMASYRADGHLCAGCGIAPDVLVLPAPEDLLGRGDRALQAAQQQLLR